MKETREQYFERIFSAKKKQRQELAKLPIEEKFKILLQLQERAYSIYKSRGIPQKELERYKPWSGT